MEPDEYIAPPRSANKSTSLQYFMINIDSSIKAKPPAYALELNTFELIRYMLALKLDKIP